MEITLNTPRIIPAFLESDVIRLQVGQNGPLQFQEIDITLMFVNDRATGSDQHRVSYDGPLSNRTGSASIFFCSAKRPTGLEGGAVAATEIYKQQIDPWFTYPGYDKLQQAAGVKPYAK